MERTTTGNSSESFCAKGSRELEWWLEGSRRSREGFIQLWRIQTVSALMAMTARRAGPLEGLLRSKVLDKVRGEGKKKSKRGGDPEHRKTEPL